MENWIGGLAGIAVGLALIGFVGGAFILAIDDPLNHERWLYPYSSALWVLRRRILGPPKRKPESP